MPEPQTYSLVVRRRVSASAERLFEAWTQPTQLQQWWGPRNVTCTDAEIDLRVGGRYRIANLLPDGRMVWITGHFEQIEPPRRLVYSWRLEPSLGSPERVTVRFEPSDGATEIIVIHELIIDAASRDSHEQGWQGCLDGLARYLSAAP